MKSRILTLGAACLALGGSPRCAKKQAAPPPAPAVDVATVLQRDVPIYVEAVGQTRGSQEVEVRARVEGYIQSVNFTEGSPVPQGQLLFQIDPGPFEATLAQAKGQYAEAQAQLAKATQDVARYKPLAEKNAIPREDYETATSVAKAAEASVNAARAVMQRAEIDLGYTRVTAPVSGLVGKAEVKTGNLVGRGESTLLTAISNIDPIHVRVSIAERDYLTMVRKRLAQVREQQAQGQGQGETPGQAQAPIQEAAQAQAQSRPTPGQAPAPGSAQTPPAQSDDIEMVLADGSVHPQRGKLFFVDRAVDPTTGTLLIEIAFPNPDHVVRPGQFAKIRAPIDFRRGAILVPQRAVQEIQATYNVAVLAAGDTIQMRTVKPGARLGSLWVIDAGLQPGERVVVEGLQKVQRGMKVQPSVV